MEKTEIDFKKCKNFFNSLEMHSDAVTIIRGVFLSTMTSYSSYDIMLCNAKSSCDLFKILSYRSKGMNKVVSRFLMVRYLIVLKYITMTFLAGFTWWLVDTLIIQT